MSIYIVIYLLLSVFALQVGTRRSTGLWVVVGVFLSFIIGLRHDVGADWYNYMKRFDNLFFSTYEEVLKGEDPGYYLLNVLAHQQDWGIYGVNMISAVIFIVGLIKFSKKQFNPWLAFAVAFPYLLLVVTMGYTRQGVAIGLVMWAIVALNDKKFIRFLILVALAASFHKSAVFMVGVGLFGRGGGGIMIRMLAVGFVGAGIYDAFFAAHQDQLMETYVEEGMESQGAYIRVFMNLVPALLFFRYKKQWQYYYDDYKFWRIIAIGAVLTVFVVGFASTAVDRMALYMVPLQLALFGRLPLLTAYKRQSQSTTQLILLYYAVVLLVWLFFAGNAHYWIPYHNLITLELF